METDAAVGIRTRRGFPQLLENSLGDSAFSQLPQARRRAKYQPISTAAIHLKNRDFLSEEWGTPQAHSLYSPRHQRQTLSVSRSLLPPFGSHELKDIHFSVSALEADVTNIQSAGGRRWLPSAPSPTISPSLRNSFSNGSPQVTCPISDPKFRCHQLADRSARVQKTAVSRDRQQQR